MTSIHTRLTEFNKTRLQGMLPLKYQAMAIDVFCFYRGTCHLFYEDLAAAKAFPQSPPVWLCGDLHIENFGSFKGDDREEYFDLNDFDEAILGPAAWEVARMVTSIFVAFESRGIKKPEALPVVKVFLDTYRRTLISGKAKSLDPRTAVGVVKTFLTTVKKRKQKELLKRRTFKKNGKLMLLVDAQRHFDIEKSLKKDLVDFIEDTITRIECIKGNYKVLDCIFRIAGTGSIGVKRYLFLLKSQDEKKKYLLLGMKEAKPSALKPYVELQQPTWLSEAVRITAIQERMQNVSPALLSPVIFKGEPYVIKQMQPSEDKINFDNLDGRYAEIERVAHDMAVLTASAHLRSGGREGSAIADELIGFGENEQWANALLNYVEKYTTQVKKDYNAFMVDYKKGLYNK